MGGSMNLPNKLTILRICLVPIVVAVYLCVPANIGIVNEATQLGLRNLLVLLIFVIASVTDYFDGMLARKNNWITSFGKFADPIADKLLVNTVLILLVWTHQANVVAVLIMIARDLIVDGLRMSAATSGEVVSAGFYGKLKTVLQMGAIVLLLLNNWPCALIDFPLADLVLWAAAIVSVYSGLIYFNKLKKYVLESM